MVDSAWKGSLHMLLFLVIKNIIVQLLGLVEALIIGRHVKLHSFLVCVCG